MNSTKIDIRQLQVLLFLNAFGTGAIALPGLAARFASNDGWLLIPGATAIALCSAYIMNSLSEMFPEESFACYSKRIIGKKIGGLLSVMLATRIIFAAGIELRIFCEIIRQILLNKTPMYIICGAMTLLAAYVAFLGYEARARMGEILFFPIVLPILILFLTASVNSDFTNIMPIFKTSVKEVIIGSFFLSFSFRRLELALVVYPYANEPKKVKMGMLKAIAVIGISLLAITFVTIIKFGAEDAKAQLWPVLRLTDTLNIPGGLFERLDAFVISLWVFSSMISTSAAIYFPADLLRGTLGAKSGLFVMLSATAVFTVSLLPRNISEAFTWLAFSEITAGMAYLFFVPSILFIIAKIRGLGGSAA